MRNETAPDDELFIHLNLAGLSALLKATEAAMATGRGRLELGSASGGITVTRGDSPFSRVTLTFSDSGGGDGLPLPASRTAVTSLGAPELRTA